MKKALLIYALLVVSVFYLNAQSPSAQINLGGENNQAAKGVSLRNPCLGSSLIYTPNYDKEGVGDILTSGKLNIPLLAKPASKILFPLIINYHESEAV